MMYGENFGTSTLAKHLRTLADDVYRRLDNGEDCTDEAKELMEGSIVLWERLVEYECE